MEIERFVQAAKDRKLERERAVLARLSPVELRLKHNGEIVEEVLHQRVLPVLTEAAMRLNACGCSSEVSSIRVEHRSLVGLPLIMRLDMKFASGTDTREMVCTLEYEGDGPSATITPRFQLPAGKPRPDPDFSFQHIIAERLTQSMVEEHVERLIECAFSGD